MIAVTGTHVDIRPSVPAGAGFTDKPALGATDPEVADLLEEELERQEDTLELIPSENLASVAVLEALGSWLNNKYAEGVPGKRYYGGCQVVDKVENLARDRAKALFGAEHANVQPHSGTQANMAVVRERPQPRRQGARDGARPGRPSQPRLPGQLQRQDLSLRAVFRRRDDRRARHGLGARARSRVPPQDDRRRLQLVSAHPRLRGLRGDRAARSAPI